MRAVDTFTNRLETARWMDVVTAHCCGIIRARLNKEITAMDIEMFGKISDAFGPSGFEGRGGCAPWRVTAGKYQVENDAMNNLYVRMPGRGRG